MTFERPTAKSGIILLGAVGFLILVFAQTFNAFDNPQEVLSVERYAPNFWFDSEEQYYPANPLDFYYDKELNELYGEDAKAKYDSLPLEEKLKNFTIFYKMDEKSDEIIYQYWLFYVFNFGKNSHFGDWESIFVFVDKKTRKINRAVGSFHQGGAMNNEVLGSEIKEDSNIWSYVGRGSHANCVDYEADGVCNSFRWNAVELSWTKEDQDNGLRVGQDNVFYKLVGIEEIKDKFTKKYDGLRNLINGEKSPKLGMVPIKIGNNTEYLLPIGGNPAENAWAKKEYKDSYAAVPLTGERVVAFGERVVEKTADVAMTPFRLAGESIGESLKDINALLGGINPFRAGIVEIVGDINAKKENFDKKGEEIASQVLVDLFIGDPTRIVKEQIKNLADADKEGESKKNDVRITEAPKKPSIEEIVEIDKSLTNEGEKNNTAAQELLIVEEDNKGVQQDTSHIIKEQEKEKLENAAGSDVIAKSDILNKLGEQNSANEQIQIDNSNILDQASQNPVPVSWQPPPMPPAPPMPLVISHINGAQVSQSQIVLEGTATPGIWVIIDKGLQHFEAKVNESGLWAQNVTLSNGISTFLIKGRNLGSVESAAFPFSLEYGIPPTATISLANYKIYNINFTVQWNGTGQNALKYDVQYKEGSSGIWQDWVLNTATTSKEFSVPKDNTVYYFRVKAVDSVTNLSSDLVQAQAEIMQIPVVINEIAWMGTGSTPTLTADEWIELHNRSGQSIDLTGWILRATDGTPYIPLSGAVAAGGYFLLERSHDDNAVSDITADQTFTGALLDSIEIMELATPENKVIDRVSGWHAGSLATRSSMERINPAAGADTQENWATNNGVTKNGLNAGGNPINGTPRAQNSAYNSSASVGTYIADTTVISVNTIWSLASSPYLLMSNSGQSPKVASGVTLTIEPGVVIKPLNKNHTALEVQGTLKAEGVSSNPIMFTSKETTPASGDFGTAILFTSSSQNSSLKYATFEYGGYFAKNMVKVDGSKVVFDTVTFKNSTGAPGLYLKNSASDVLNSIFQDVLTGVVVEGTAGVTIQNSSFTNVTTGVEILAAAKAAVSNNSFSQVGIAISMRASSLLTASGNSAAHNGSGDGSIKGILVTTETGEEVIGNVVWKADLPYVLISNSNKWLTVASGATLTLEPGVVIKPKSSAYPSSPYNAIEVKGNLIAQGTESQPVVITSFRDDNALYGGDTNNDGSTTSPAANDWHKILIKATSSGSNLSHMKIRYGGSWSANPLTIEVGASVSQSNVVIE